MLSIPDAPPPPDPGIPSLGGLQIAPLLRHLARKTSPDTAIVEIGSWLGAGTWQIADSIRGRAVRPEFHVFDHFRANKLEAERATEAGLEVMEGQDTRPLVNFLLSDLETPVHLHKCDLRKATWKGGPIGLLIEDAAKRKHLFASMLETFGPSFVPGETILVLMDYHLWREKGSRPMRIEYRAQTEFIEAHPASFEHLGEPDIRRTSTAVFRYTEELDFAAAVADWWAEDNEEESAEN